MKGGGRQGIDFFAVEVYDEGMKNNSCDKCGRDRGTNNWYCDDCQITIIKSIFNPKSRREGFRILLSAPEVKQIIKALEYYREENGGDEELENDLNMVLKGTL